VARLVLEDPLADRAKDRIAGAAKELKGSVKEAVGKAVGDAKLQSDGKAEKWLKMNAEFAVKWPNITRKGTPPADGKAHEGETDKFQKYFTPEPGKGE